MGKKYTDAKNDQPTLEELEEKVKNFKETETKENENQENTNILSNKNNSEKTQETEEVKKQENKNEQEDNQNNIDYKKKFIESSKEAMVLYHANKQIRDAIEKANQIPEPSDEELQKEYGDDWEYMSEAEKKLIKDNIVNKKRFELLQQVITAGKDMEQWIGKAEKFVNDPKILNQYPELEGKQEEFIAFVSKPTRKGVPLEDLVGSFLFHYNATKTKTTGKMFETGTAGLKEKSEKIDNKISIEEAQNLMKTDFKKYKELLKEGKIDLNV